MAKLTLEDLRKMREAGKKQIDTRQTHGKEIFIVIGMGTCGIAAGAKNVLNAFIAKLDEKGISFLQMIFFIGCYQVQFPRTQINQHVFRHHFLTPFVFLHLAAEESIHVIVNSYACIHFANQLKFDAKLSILSSKHFSQKSFLVFSKVLCYVLSLLVFR